mmetsp:Transcript_138021/g.253888  ORF Transcript_138021/g.253888 Transcript_138021/m.253888 type:complete len:83 (+) Transcript_138021:106-354(+)
MENLNSITNGIGIMHDPPYVNSSSGKSSGLLDELLKQKLKAASILQQSCIGHPTSGFSLLMAYVIDHPRSHILAPLVTCHTR